jgi:hypothetical protein
LKLDLDLDAMSLEERNEAAAVLRQVLDRLSAEDPGGKSGQTAKKTAAHAKSTRSKSS